MILCVDDERTNRVVLRHMLEAAGLAMEEAPDAATALALISQNDYRCVLMDLRMPGMDGLTAVRLIRARPDAKAKTPIIVVTADVTPDLEERCAQAGADDVVVKPVRMERLLKSIVTLMAARSLRGRGDGRDDAEPQPAAR